ncbi:MAG TPA: response regulator [Gemmatimonadales bacterium]|nr:response regulator [Gemmatimonadales bacterium]
MPVVLLVDDDDHLRHLVTTLLESEGYEVIAAADGAEGLTRFRDLVERAGIVVTDLSMPGMNGREMATAMRRVRPDLPMLFFAGYTLEEARATGLLPDGEPYLAKPFHLDELVERVTALCR